MKKIISVLLAAVLITATLAACGGSDDGGSSGGTSGGGTASGTTADNTTSGGTTADDTPVPASDGDTASDAAPVSSGNQPYEDEGIVDGRFVETRKITVELFDRFLDTGTPPQDNVWSNWIKERVLEDLNIEIEWVIVRRWGEDEDIPNLLATGQAPDVCVTYNHQAITEYWQRGAVMDIEPYFDGYRELLPNVWNLLGPVNMHAFRDYETGEYYAIETRLANNSRINTFVRRDWLDALGLSEPTTTQEFEDMLVAFKDNAATLLPNNPTAMVPLSMGQDVGWRANNLLVSFVPDNMTDKDAFVYGADDRQFLWPGYKEGVRLLNKWYNMGLIWPDFYLYGPGDQTEDNNIKAGNVGAIIHNWDYPFRNGENGLNPSMQLNVGPDAALVAVDPFKNDAGVYRKFVNSSFDRKIFFPVTNTEPLASAMYVDWISRPDVIFYLQTGIEGTSHIVHPDGAIEIIDNEGNEWQQNSPNNIDYTITINGLDFGDPELTGKSLGLAYPPNDPVYIGRAYETAQTDARIIPNFNVGELATQSSNALKSKRDEVLNQAVAASVEDFDRIYDSGMEDYLSAGGQAMIDERREAFERYIE